MSKIPPPAAGPARAFSATDAAFAGLRLARRDPATLLVWAGLFIALYAVMGAVMVASIGPQMMQLQAQAASGARPDPSRTFALMGAVLPAYGLITFASLLFYGLMFAAVNRAILRPAAGRPGRLAFGADELLQVALLLVAFVVVFVASFAITFVVAFAVALAAAAVQGVAVLVGLLGFLASVAAIVFVMVRLSLASPLALDTRKLDLAASWRMTRGRFWSLLGAYLLAWVMALVLVLVVFVVFVAAATAAGGLSTAGLVFRPDMSSLAAYFSPVMTAWLVVASALYALVFAMLVGVPADAYRQLTGAGAPGGAPAQRIDRSTHFGQHV